MKYWRIKMKNKIIFNWLLLIAICSFIPLTSGYAQAGHWYGLATYQVSFSTGDLNDFIDDVSWRGFGLDFRYGVKPDVTVGFVTGWNIFYQQITETTQLNTNPPGAITGESNRYTNFVPVMLNAHYYAGERGKIRPYIGLCAGGYYVNQELQLGVAQLQNDSWEWGVAPELGVVIPVQRGLGIVLAGKYNFIFTEETVFEGTQLEKNVKNSYWGIQIGVAWQSY
jgi:outer membrane protein W